MGDFLWNLARMWGVVAATDWDLKAKGLAERHTPGSPTRKQVLRSCTSKSKGGNTDLFREAIPSR